MRYYSIKCDFNCCFKKELMFFHFFFRLNIKKYCHSLAFSDSTMSNFLILFENIRFTSIDMENVIEADNMRFVMVNLGIV